LAAKLGLAGLDAFLFLFWATKCSFLGSYWTRSKYGILDWTLALGLLYPFYSVVAASNKENKL